MVNRLQRWRERGGEGDCLLKHCHSLVVLSQSVQNLALPGIGLRQRERDGGAIGFCRKRPLQQDDRTASVVIGGLVLQEDVCVKLREFAKTHARLGQQISIIHRIACETIKVIGGFFEQTLLRLERTRNLANFVKELKQHRVGNLPNVGEMAYGFCLRRTSDAGLIRCRDDAAKQTDRSHRGKQNRPSIALNKLAAPVRKRVCARRHRKVFGVTPYVLGQLQHRGVAPSWLFAQRHQDDIVKIATQALFQTLDRSFVERRQIAGCLSRVRNNGARSCRFLLADFLREFERLRGF